MDEKVIIDKFINTKDIAVAGVSENKKKFGSIVYRELKKKGYKVYGLNPKMDEFDEDKCFKSIQDLPDNVKLLVTVTQPEVTETLVEEAIQKGFTMVWMQQGSESDKAIETAKSGGLDVISNRCIMMFAEPVASIHSFHKFLAKLFGRYPKAKKQAT